MAEETGSYESEEQQALRAEAAKYGLKFQGRPSAETMRQRLDEYLAKEGLERAQKAAPPPAADLALTPEEFARRQAADAKLNAGKLVRCRITCMNPNKKNWTGEIISVGSAKVGTFKKFIPFNSDEPYHVPLIIYNYLKERKCAIRNVRKTPDGREHIETKMINEFAVELLPPLTMAELEDLKKRQAMARGAA